MPWSKGAIVIVKHGDREWADTMEQAIAIRRASMQEVSELKKENDILKRDKELSKIHDDRFTDIAINSLKHDYRKIRPRSKLVDILLAPYALLVYGFSLFVEKYITARGVNKK